MGAADRGVRGRRARSRSTRDRFLPVKTTNDLLVLRSDCYRLADEPPPRARGRRRARCRSSTSTAATTSWSATFDERFPDGVPSLRGAEELVVEGDWTFGADVTVVGAGTARGRRRAGVDGRAPRSAEVRVRDHGCHLMPTDRLSTVDEHVERIVESLEPLPPLRPAAAGGARPPGVRGHRRADGPAGLRQLRDGRLRRLLRRRRHRLRGPPGAPAGGGGDGRRPDQALRALARAPRSGS